jgi:hypothetical protein
MAPSINLESFSSKGALVGPPPREPDKQARIVLLPKTTDDKNELANPLIYRFLCNTKEIEHTPLGEIYC